MKITGFNPLITTENLEETVALFEALGFERRHTKQDLGESHSTLVRMGKDDFRIDISGTPGVTQARTYIRMNVDNFQEGYDFLVSKGFKSKWGNAPTEDASSMGVPMESPSGFTIALAEHLKKD